MASNFLSKWFEVFRGLTASQQKKQKKMIRVFMRQKLRDAIRSRLDGRAWSKKDYKCVAEDVVNALRHAWDTRSGPFSGIK